MGNFFGRLGLGIASGGLSEVNNYLGGQASQGFDTASQGAQGAQQGYGDLANWNWDQAMGGLDQANSAYNPSNAYWNATYGNQGPNALQQWWSQNQNQFGNQTQGDRTMGQFRNYMTQPTASNSAYQNAQSALGGYQTGSQSYASRFGDQLQNRSAAEQAYNPGQYAAPGAAEQFGSFAMDALGGRSRAANLQYQDVNNMGNFAKGLAGQQGQGATAQGSPEIGNYYRGANDVSQYAAGQMGALQGPGQYEQFVQQDINGTNPQLQRETDQGLARINQEMARRGGFSSGAADTSIGNFLGSQAAADYQNRASRAQSAQQMQLGRVGAGQSLAQASAQSELAQGQGLQGLAGQTDTEAMARLQQQMQAQQGASGEAQANRQGALSYATAGDQSENARIQALSGVMGQSQQMQLARLQGGMNAAGQSDSGMLNRMNAGFGMQQGADQSQLARAMGLYGMAQGSDQASMSQYGMLGNMSNQMDQNSLARLMGAGGMAGSVAGMNEQQMNDAFRSRFGLDQANAGNIGNFYGMGMQGYDTAQGNSMNALANYYGLLGQGQQASAAVPWQMASLGVQGARAAAGGGGR